MRIFISAGEASGDRYGAALVDSLRQRGLPADAVLQAIGGRGLREAGAEIVCDSGDWGAIGIVQGLRVAPRALQGLRLAKAALLKGSPGLLIPIDFGFFNVRLARSAKEAGWKVLYFMPPGAWRKNRQGEDLHKITDAVVTSFPWSAEILNRNGATAHFFGHPIKQLINQSQFKSEKRQEMLAVLPGSRLHEIELNLPLIAEALKGLAVPVEFGIAPTINVAKLREDWETLTGRERDGFANKDLYVLLRTAKAAIVCSGTATLEAALCHCPMVVVYKLTRVTYTQGVLMGLKNRNISLPNMLLGRDVIPEFAGASISAALLRAEVDLLLNNPSVREVQIKAFEELDELLGADDAITRTADLALTLAST